MMGRQTKTNFASTIRGKMKKCLPQNPNGCGGISRSLAVLALIVLCTSARPVSVMVIDFEDVAPAGGSIFSVTP